ncbi:hypothetical protein [Pantoea sp. KPR_PJ]|uniref:hypothetical protein n=1 Tax=Pantoea sp. KPR_PJ TaxID=2738375 RepID=UPI003527757E
MRLKTQAFEWLPMARAKWQYPPENPFSDHIFNFVRLTAQKKLLSCLLFRFFWQIAEAGSTFLSGLSLFAGGRQ